MGLSHFDSNGQSRMVNVGAKAPTHRMARASAVVRMKPATIQMIQDKKFAKGDVFEVARLAGIMAAKRTDELIPLCHSLGLEAVSVEFSVVSESKVRVESSVETFSKTGVEMEAMLCVSTAALTLYDMCKSVDRAIQIEILQLEEKMGGKSGHFLRQPEKE